MMLSHYFCSDWLVLSIEGEFDAHAVSQNREALMPLVNLCDHGMVVDVSNMTFLDSSGLGAIVSMYKSLSIGDKKMVIVGGVGQPAKLLQLLRIDKTINSVATMKDWLSGVSASVPAYTNAVSQG